MAGLGSFMEGVFSGVEAHDKAAMSREYREYLKQRNLTGRKEMAGDEAIRSAEYKRNHGDLSGYEPMDFQVPQDPAGIRMLGWLKQKMGNVFGQSDSSGEMDSTGGDASYQYMPVGDQSSGATTYGIPGYADGGRVDENDRRYRGLGGGVNFGDMSNTAGAISDIIYGPIDQTEYPEGAYGAGKKFRDVVVKGAKDVGHVAKGLWQDTGIPGAVDKAVDFGAGVVGADEIPDNSQAPAIAPPPTANVVAVKDMPPSPDADVAPAVTANANAPAKTDEQIAQGAISSGKQEAAENFDYRMLPATTNPEDLPSMTTKDWADYRTKMIDGLLLKGKDPDQAYKIVDDITVGQQMKGMDREIQKAQAYMAMGDLKAASFAIRQGFQYFPNGVDVKFAVQKGKDGQQHLVALGKDEQTGKITGKPMIITPETLGVMRQNFSDPTAFRTWTKDGREAQMNLRKQQMAESNSRSEQSYRKESAITARMNAETARQRAAAAANKPGAGVKQTDIRAGIKVAKEYLFNHGVDLDEQQSQLAEEMVGMMRNMQPDIRALPDEKIAAIILQAATQGKLQDLYEELSARQGG